MDRADRLDRQVKLRDLKVLLAVVEAGTMARAAERLAVSQPVVSKTIAELERTLGVPLLDRSHKGVEPTAYGHALAARGAAVFDELRQAARDIEHLADPSAGAVRMSATDALAIGLVPYAIEEARRSHPRLTFHVRSTVTGAWFYDDLRRRQVDFAVGRVALRPTDTDLVAEVILQERLTIVTGRDTVLPPRRPLRLEHLADAPWILPRPDSEVGVMARQVFRNLAVAEPRDAIASSIVLTIALLAAGGQFFAFIPSSILRFGALRSHMRVVLTLPEVPPGPVAIVTLAGRTLTPAAELFIAHLRRLAAESEALPAAGEVADAAVPVGANRTP